MQSLPGQTLVIQSTWIYNRVHFTQESMCLVVEASNSSHSSCYFNVVSFESPWTKPKDFQKGLFWTAGAAHWPVNVTKQKSEHFASNQLFPNTPHCFGCGTVPGSSLYEVGALMHEVDALMHRTRGVKSDQWSQNLQKAHSGVQITRLFSKYAAVIWFCWEFYKMRISASCGSTWYPCRIWLRVEYVKWIFSACDCNLQGSSAPHGSNKLPDKAHCDPWSWQNFTRKVKLRSIGMKSLTGLCLNTD